MISLFGPESDSDSEYESESGGDRLGWAGKRLPDVGTMGFAVVEDRTDEETNWWR